MGFVLATAAVAAIALPTSAEAEPVETEPVDTGTVEATIIGGVDATIQESPWQVLVVATYTGGEAFSCGGSILNATWVLTAAHCVTNGGATPLQVSVTAGMTDRNFPGQQVLADQITMHPGYNDQTFLNDIALIRLASPLALDGVNAAAINLPIGLPAGWPALNTPALITGWGETAPDVTPAILQKATISVLAAPGQFCTVGGSLTYAPDQMMCAGTLTGPPGACRGDSGGAAAVQTNGQWYVAGLTSHGSVPCAQANDPAVYTRVTAYLGWINSVISGSGNIGDLTVVGGAAAVSNAVVNEVNSAIGVVPTRLSGPNRYATSVAVAQAMFPAGVSNVYIATGDDYPDALSASNGLAAGNAALLLTDPFNIPPEIAVELERLKPLRVFIIGGTGAVFQRVAEQIAVTVGFEPVRLAGANRYQTAVDVSFNSFPLGVDTVYLATGNGFADALSASAAMTGGNAALLLTQPDQMPAAVAAELARLSPTSVIVVGGTAAVSNAVMTQVQALTGIVPQRLGGANRYATAALVNAHAFPTGNTQVFLATGTAFPDALSAAQAVISRRAALLLTERDTLPAATLAELQRLNR